MNGWGLAIIIMGNSPQGFQVMSPMRMEHKFDSLRERWDKRKGIKWLLTASAAAV